MQTELHTNPIQTSVSLALQVSEQGICFQDEKPIDWKESIASIAKILKGLDLQVAQILNLEIEIIYPSFLLLPDAYNDPLYRIAFLEKALGEHCMNGHELHEQACPNVESTLLFLIPSLWKDQLATLFPLAKIEYKHLMANELAKSKLYIHPRIQVYLQEQHAYVTYFQHGRLQLINVFPYEHELALAYYLHAIRDTFDIQWNQESIRLQGPEASNVNLIADLIRLNIPIS